MNKGEAMRDTTRRSAIKPKHETESYLPSCLSLFDSLFRVTACLLPTCFLQTCSYPTCCPIDTRTPCIATVHVELWQVLAFSYQKSC
ncbi:hypothetical protein T492DRAFT_921992 [Pavlovales sp. CCMP2436]|nr:hypothetical protein T492DRAFT_921992 [Pavlovales sp. CCMP2436]